ncbi:MAG: thrombospondin type 3 repeat-containing protein [Gemmatimonadales bacterium]|nr:thrombospondin type 3 repeat-containing protein [Gemmatimonadales bacterium]
MRFAKPRLHLILLVLVSLLVPEPGLDLALAQEQEPSETHLPERIQDSFSLTRLNSGVMPPDGLLSLVAGCRQSSTVLIVDEFLGRISQLDYFLRAEANILTWMGFCAELNGRTWSGGKGLIPPTGYGLADGSWQITAGSPLWEGSPIHGALFGGSNLPVGEASYGLAEGVFSPTAGAALTFRLWAKSRVPEMRFHLNVNHRWNRQEEAGYGMGADGFQPWPPRYPSAAQVGGSSRNDLTTFAAALEFRKTTTSLWIEYSEDRFPDTPTISGREMYRGVAAGLRWGVMEGWALHADYQVCLSTDDLSTDWEPGFPEMVSTIAVSRQFSIGGRDVDNDGIVDRHDQCPLLPEDLDDFQDTDGCPDPDNDGDGVPDERDLAPNIPEDLDGFMDEDGIPDRDNDGDGILDAVDLCPDEPEDFDGHRDDDGCPDDFEDRDGDGIEDNKDACPDIAEDPDGFEDEDGCPESDNDLDGIPDEEDECPDEAENYNGVDDLDGCPEEE